MHLYTFFTPSGWRLPRGTLISTVVSHPFICVNTMCVCEYVVKVLLIIKVLLGNSIQACKCTNKPSDLLDRDLTVSHI
jgi:hypothetical protein